jgi:hypothetical protein
MGLITDIIKGLPISAVLEDKLKEAEKRYERLETDNRQLREENFTLQKRINELTKSDDYVEVEGLLWKRKVGGGFEGKPRCPICPNHPVLFDFPPRVHWNCSKCNGTFDYATPPH